MKSNSRISIFCLTFIFLLITNVSAQNSALSMHLSANDYFEGDIIVKTLKVPHRTLNTYYCALMWNVGGEAGGYCGMQNHPSGNNFIFSLWDPISTSKAIEAYYTGRGTEVSRFGGEGTGLKSMNFELGWAEEHEYRMVSRSWAFNGHSYFGFWVQDFTSNSWTHLVTMDYPVANIKFKTSTGSFLEDWSSTGHNMRKVFQKDGYKRKTNGEWYPFTQMRYSINEYDIAPGRRSYNYKDNYNAGVVDGYYFMQSGGTTTPDFSGPSINLSNNFSNEPQVDPIVYYFTEVSDSLISWTVPQSSTPQFRFRIEMNAELIVDSIEAETRSYKIEANNGNMVFFTIEDIFGNTVQKMVRVGTDEVVPKTPLGLKVDEFGSSSFTVSWEQVDNADEYSLQIQKNALWETVAPVTGTSYTFTNLEGGSRYRARVNAINVNGESAYSDYVWTLTGVNNEEIISQDEWTLHYVNSEETQGENGAAINSFDGNDNTMWHTEWSQSTPSHPHEIQINLNGNYLVDGFKYLPRQDGGINGTIADYELYISNNGTDWGDQVAEGTFLGTTQEKKVTFDGVEGRYIRFIAESEVNGGAWASAAEINLLGKIVVGVEGERNSIPMGYELFEAYPNPFNPETNISFSVPKTSKIKISVYNVMGQKMVDLTNKNYSAGKYMLQWNAQDFSSGTYFYRMDADNFSQTKKINLIK